MKIALITGASSGLGREFARQIPKLYQNLDEIWVVARRAERLNELEMELKVPVRIFDGDLNQDYIYKKLGIALGKSHANVRMLVNAAGYGKIGTFCEYGWKEEENKKSEKGFLEQLTLEEELVYRFCCTENEVTSEEILQQSGLSVVKLTMLLLQLQLKGYIREVGSGRYIVTRKD